MSDEKSPSPAPAARTSKPAKAIRRFQAVPLLRHMHLWQKLLCIVAVLQIPALFLLKDFVSRASQDIVLTSSELCLDEHSCRLRVILENQVALRLGRGQDEAGLASLAANARSTGTWPRGVA